jgi:diguanylate cyclase
MTATAPQTAAGDSSAQSQAWATLLERMVRGLESGSKQWTVARRKDSVQRVLAANRSDMNRLRQRLEPLIAAWEGDRATAPDHAADAPEPVVLPEAQPGTLSAPAPVPMSEAAPSASAAVDAPAAISIPLDWTPVVASLETTVRAALPGDEPRAGELADELAAVWARIGREGATPALAAEIDAICARARRLLSHRHHLVDELGRLCADLSQGLTELSEDESWARGQSEAMQQRLADGISARSVRAAAELLAETRARQQRVRGERDAARDTLKSLIPRMLAELSALEEQTGRFEGNVGRHAEAIERADSLEGLAGVVRAMVEETRAVQQVVGGARSRMQQESVRATELQSRVQQLEGELRRLSDEVQTDALTQVANRRGLEANFAVECAKLERDPAPLAVGLIDIDNFKKLNDTLGHAAGDKALQSLAAKVSADLRPGDSVARFGGEEFVVLLPNTAVEEAQTVLTRLQRALSASLFMHENREVFVTFSAGVTAFRPGEPLQTALERADEALYEAKRTGKNRTCIA